MSPDLSTKFVIELDGELFESQDFVFNLPNSSYEYSATIFLRQNNSAFIIWKFPHLYDELIESGVFSKDDVVEPILIDAYNRFTKKSFGYIIPVPVEQYGINPINVIYLEPISRRQALFLKILSPTLVDGKEKYSISIRFYEDETAALIWNRDNEDLLYRSLWKDDQEAEQSILDAYNKLVGAKWVLAKKKSVSDLEIWGFSN